VLSHVEVPVQRPNDSGHQDQREKEDTAIPEVAGEEETTGQQVSSHGQKRPRDEDEVPDELEEPESKVLRAMFTQMGGFDDPENFEPIDWALAAAEGVIEEIPIPNAYVEAVNDPEWGHLWKEAVAKEIESLIGNRTWEEIVPPKGANLTTSKWVFTVKRKTDGSVERFKARLVARGFSQKHGIDFEDTFAPTVRHDTLRAFLAVVCMEDLELHSVDVNNAFTESILKEDIYMQPPPGLELPPGKVLHILRSLYGLKQAARDWNQLCVSELRKLGFIQSEADPCLLTLPSKKLIILVYVDDVTIAGPDLDDIQWFKREFGKIFKIKDLGETEKILGVRVIRNRQEGTLKIDQTHYVKDVLTKLCMNKDKAHPVFTPISSYEALRKAGPGDTRASREEYQRKIGHWMYLGILTRPDLAFVLGRLSQYLADPADFHMSSLKTMSRYIRSSQDLGVQYSRKGHQTLEGYSDSDFASNKGDRISILGNVFFLAGGPISWMSKKQKSVATSTMEAEYMAMSACAKQSQFLAQVLRDMGMHHLIGPSPFKPVVKESVTYQETSPVQLKGDNQAALLQVKDAHTHDRSKHIDIAYHFVRCLYRLRRITVEFVPTSDMAADGLTKVLQRPLFQRFVRLLGLVEY
jgi:hypothetical protein